MKALETYVTFLLKRFPTEKNCHTKLNFPHASFSISTSNTKLFFLKFQQKIMVLVFFLFRKLFCFCCWWWWFPLLVSLSFPSSGFLFRLATADAVKVPIQLYGVNYHTRQGQSPDDCKSRIQLMEELLLLQKITNRIRISSLADCKGGELLLEIIRDTNFIGVGELRKSINSSGGGSNNNNSTNFGLQVWLGIRVSEEPNVFLEELITLQSLLERGLINNNDNGNADTTVALGIAVGSEAISRGGVTIEDNVWMKNQVKDMLLSYGINDIPVTIVDTAQTYRNNPNLLTSSVDVIMANIPPVIMKNNNNNNAEGILSDNVLDDMTSIRNQPEATNKALIIGCEQQQRGLLQRPTSAEGIELRFGSPEYQIQYFKDFFCTIDQRLQFPYYWFSPIDDRIQDSTNTTINNTWGFFYSNSTIKPHFETLSFVCDDDDDDDEGEEEDSIEYSFEEIDWTIPYLMQDTSLPTVSPSSTTIDNPTMATIATTTTEAPSTESNILSITAAPHASRTCAFNEMCLDVGMVDGHCCPTSEWIYLPCCNPRNVWPSSSPTNIATDSGSTTFEPTFGPTSASAEPSFTPPSITTTGPPTTSFPIPIESSPPSFETTEQSPTLSSPTPTPTPTPTPVPSSMNPTSSAQLVTAIIPTATSSTPSPTNRGTTPIPDAISSTLSPTNMIMESTGQPSIYMSIPSPAPTETTISDDGSDEDDSQDGEDDGTGSPTSPSKATVAPPSPPPSSAASSNGGRTFQPSTLLRSTETSQPVSPIATVDRAQFGDYSAATSLRLVGAFLVVAVSVIVSLF